VEVGFRQNLAENCESLNNLDMSRTFSVSSRGLVCITGASGAGPVGLNPGYGSILPDLLDNNNLFTWGGKIIFPLG
jgi:hypothetical protein